MTRRRPRDPSGCGPFSDGQAVPFHAAVASGSELLFDDLRQAYEPTSVIVTTNLPFEKEIEVLDSERLIGAAPNLNFEPIGSKDAIVPHGDFGDRDDRVLGRVVRRLRDHLPCVRLDAGGVRAIWASENRVLVGWLEILGGLAQLLSYVLQPLGLLGSGGLCLQMAMGVVTRRRIGDSLRATSPTLAFMVINAFLFAAFLKP